MEKQITMFDTFLTLIGQHLTAKEIIDSILKEICNYYKGDSGFVLSIDHEKNTFYCSSEWCSENVKPNIYSYQGVPLKESTPYFNLFPSKHKPIYVEDVNKIKINKELLGFYKESKIDSFISCPLTQTGVVVGYAGIDNPREHLDDLEFLRVGCVFITYVSIREQVAINKSSLDSTSTENTLFLEAIKHSYSLNVVVNLKKNSYHINNSFNLVPKDVSSSGKYDDFIEQIASHIPDENGRERYRREFSRLYLAESANNGKTIHTIRYRLDLDEGEPIWIETSVLVVPGNEYRAIYLSKSVDIEIREVKKREVGVKQNIDIINGITTEYTVLYRIDFTTGKMDLFSVTDKMAESKLFIKSNTDYSKTFNMFINFFVHPDYRDALRKYCDKDYVTKLMAHKKKDSFFFLRKYDGEYLWTEQVIIKFDGEDEPLTSAAVGFIEKDKEYKLKLQSELNDKVLLSLSSNYVAVFNINIKKDIAKTVILADRFKENMHNIDPNFDGIQTVSEKIAIIGNNLVVEDDREYFFNQMLGRDLASELSFGNPIIINFRSKTRQGGFHHYQLKIVPPENPKDEWAICGVRDIEDEFESTKEYQKQLEELNAKLVAANVLANSFVGTYENACYVNLLDGTYSVYVAKDNGKKRYGEITDYLTAVSVYINNNVNPEDRAKLLDTLKYENIMQRLLNEERITLIFRDNHTGIDKFYRLTIARGADDIHAAIGFVDVDKSIREEKNREEKVRRAEEKTKTYISSLAQDYEEVFFVDLTNREIEGIITERPRISKQLSDAYPKWREAKTIFDLQTMFAENFLVGVENYKSNSKLSWDYISNFVMKNEQYVQNFLLKIKDKISNYQLRFVPAMENGEVVGIVVGLRDIESEIKTQKERDEEKERSLLYHNALVRSSEGYIEVNLTKDVIIGEPIYSNKVDSEPIFKAVKEFNYRYNDVFKWLGEKRIRSNQEEFLKVCNSEYLIEQYNKGIYMVSTHTSSIDVNGDNIEYEINFYLSKDSISGDIQGLSLIYDITKEVNARKAVEEEQIKYERELEEARNKAEEASRAKTSFLFNMSHDIRTPMNAITGFTSIAQKHLDDSEKIKDYLQKIDSSSKQLLRLINEVLDMSRVESGNISIEEKAVNANVIVEDFIDMCRGLETKYNVEFKYDASDIKNNLIYADTLHINQILINIISNAFKYTGNGGKVSFKVHDEESEITGYTNYIFEIEDNGIGMSSEFIKKIYEPFSRERTSTVSKIEGAGLGMAIVKKLVDLVDGKIEVSSELNKGTKVTIRIPFRKQEGSYVEEPQIDVDYSVFKNKRVLVVEDNELNREISKDILEEQGLIVETAEDGDIAVEMIQKHVNNKEYDYYDAILMDVQMPRMNGFAATKAIREIPAPEGYHFPIIAMTANAFEEDRKRSLEAGMDDHLAKPIDIQVLFKTLARFIKE